MIAQKQSTKHRSRAMSGYRLAALNCLAAAPVGLQLPFLPLWLSGIGLSPTAIGAIQGVTPIARFLANMIVPPIADRTGRFGAIIVGCAIAMAASTALMGFFPRFWPVLILMAFAAFAQAPMFALTDSLTLEEMRRRAVAGEPPLHYGPIRGAGSLAALALMLLGGWLVELFPPQTIIVILTIAIASLIPGLIWLAPRATDKHEAGMVKPAKMEPIERPKLIVATILASSFAQSSHSGFYTFGSIAFRAQGYDDISIGLFWGIGVAAEIALFVLAARRVGGPEKAFSFLMIGSGVAVVRWLIMAATDHPLVLIFAQCMHAGTFACTHLGSVYALSLLVGESRRAQGQGWAGAANSLIMAAVTLATGPLWAAFGVKFYNGMAAIAALGFLFAGLSARMMRQTIPAGNYPQSADSGG